MESYCDICSNDFKVVAKDYCTQEVFTLYTVISLSLLSNVTVYGKAFGYIQ